MCMHALLHCLQLITGEEYLHFFVVVVVLLLLLLLLVLVFDSFSPTYIINPTTDSYSRCCATFGQGSGPIYLANIYCTGRESSLLDCPFYRDEIGNVDYCSHSYDAGVRCPCKDLGIVIM